MSFMAMDIWDDNCLVLEEGLGTNTIMLLLRAGVDELTSRLSAEWTEE
jgi:hypothetical protein